MNMITEKVLTVKSSVKYKVALCGFLQNEKFELSQVDKIINEKAPKNTGIWIEESSREDIQKLLEQIAKNEYEIKRWISNYKKIQVVKMM